jgi:hypothetical protein
VISAAARSLSPLNPLGRAGPVRSPGFDGQAGLGRADVHQAGPAPDLPELAPGDAGQAGQAGGGEVGDGALERRPGAC